VPAGAPDLSLDFSFRGNIIITCAAEFPGRACFVLRGFLKDFEFQFNKPILLVWR